jgi:FAD-linked oxidoreductase
MSASRAYPFWTNWNRNLVYRPEELATPHSVDEVSRLVAEAAHEGRTVRPVGSGYSYTPLAQTDHVMLSLEAMSGVERVDAAAGTAVVGAGTRLSTLTRELARHGAAIANLGDIDQQTVAGAIATGTHGTGITIGSLSSQVLAMTLVDGQGQVRELTEATDRDLLRAARVGLGALGVITSVTLKVQPAYQLLVERQGTTLARLLRDLDTLVRANRNFEFFWYPNHGLAYSKKMNQVSGRRARNGAVDRAVRFANDILIENALIWVACEHVRRFPGARRRWLDIGRSVVPTETAVVDAHRAYATPRLVRHHEIEYAIPYSRAAETLGLLDEMLARHPVKTMIPVEVRFTAGEDIPLSMSQGRDVMYVAVHAYRREDHLELFDLCEDLFLRHDGRPHWGKLHTLQAAELRRRYPCWDEFQSARARLDPADVFLNGYLRRVLAPQDAAAAGGYRGAHEHVLSRPHELRQNPTS